MVRQRRSWYVPASIAAVLVLSVSVVTLVHEEKGDELAQPPPIGAAVPAKSSAPAVSADDSLSASPALSSPAPSAAIPDATLRDAVTDKLAHQPFVKADQRPAALEAAGELAQKQRAQLDRLESKAAATIASEGAVDKDQLVSTASAPKKGPPAQVRRDGPESGPADRLSTPATGVRGAASAPAAAVGGLTVVRPTRERRPDPFPMASEREAAMQASRDMAQARARSESDHGVTRDAMPAVPTASAESAAVRRPAPPVETIQMKAAPLQSTRDARSVSPSPPAAKPALPRQGSAPAAPPVWLGDLENQPLEKWLEKLTEFRRDGRQADADKLLAAFRLRFPEHPASLSGYER